MKLASIALPTGPYDWHPERIARAVFDQRIAHVRLVMASRGITHLVVHGNGFDHGALAWLTHFTPKLGPAYALIPTAGEPRLLFSGGPGMRPSASRLTWIEDVVALKGLRGDLQRWLSETAGGNAVALGLSEGQAMARADWLGVNHAASGTEPLSLDEAVDAMRRYKTPFEREIIGHAAAMLAATALSLEQSLADTGLRTSALGAEAVAYRVGAQDVRIRMSEQLGKPVLTLGSGDLRAGGPVQVSVGLRASGYWACGQFVAGPGSFELRKRARDILMAVVPALRPGAAHADIAANLPDGVSVDCRGIGVSPEEAPWLDRGERLSVADVCVVTITAPPDGGGRSVWSIIASIGASGSEVLWMPPGMA